MRATKQLVLIALAAAVPAWAEKTVAVTPGDINQVRELDEVIVQGSQGLSAARKAIEEAEDRFYSRWNQVNGDRSFDINCHVEVRTGTLFGNRVCEPAFVQQIREDAAQRTMMSLQGVMSSDGGNFVVGDITTQRMLREQQLKKRMLEIAGSDPELKRALVERARLDEYYRDLRKEKFRGRLVVWD